MTLAPFAVPEYTAADFSQETWWLSLIKAVFIIVFLIANVLLALWVERRGLGRMQTRPGPNVAGSCTSWPPPSRLSRRSASTRSSRWART